MDEKEMSNDKKLQKEYEQYIKAVTPTHSLWQQMQMRLSQCRK